MPTPPTKKSPFTTTKYTQQQEKDASITPSSRFLSFPQVSNHSSHSPPLVTSTTNQVQCLRDFERFGFGEQNRGVFLRKNHIKSVIFSMKVAENYSSLPLLFLMYIFIFTMIIWWPHPRFCLGYLMVLLNAEIFQNSASFTLQRANEHPVFWGVFLPISRPGNTGPPPPILSSWLTHNPWWLLWKSKR